MAEVLVVGVEDVDAPIGAPDDVSASSRRRSSPVRGTDAATDPTTPALPRRGGRRWGGEEEVGGEGGQRCGVHRLR
jgi:hypothetical protein